MLELEPLALSERLRSFKTVASALLAAGTSKQIESESRFWVTAWAISRMATWCLASTPVISEVIPGRSFPEKMAKNSWDITRYYFLCALTYHRIMTQEMDHQFDVIIVGSGFGGSVSAMRLAQKGYRVAVLESGKRYRAADFPKSNWNAPKYIWAPLLRCFGFQKITMLKGVMVLHGSGVGGGSLVYANTLMQPLENVFDDPAWPSGVRWKESLDPHYETARKMLGVTKNPMIAEGEEALREIGRRMGVESTFHATEVGVFFGTPNQRVKDPYFSGQGPDRKGCNFCGGCMVGCRHEAKNTLDYNYLYFAEKWGSQVFPETRVARMIPPDSKGADYVIETRSSTSWLPRRGPVFKAPRVIIAAGVLGTVELLLKNRERYGTLPKISRKTRRNGPDQRGEPARGDQF